MQAKGELDEAPEIATPLDRPHVQRRLDLHRHEQRRLVHTSTDVFTKAREHDRAAVLAAARDADVLPYFHVLTSPAMPVVEMEGAERIMLGSTNYLGLTGDERVLKGPEDELHRYGTGLTGSRLLNWTIPLHP